MAGKKVDVSVVLPCRNEEKAVEGCIIQIKDVLQKNKLNGEIIVSDSSKDKSPLIAGKLGARVVKHDQAGYGIAYLEGFKIVRGKYIFMADCDGTYDFHEIPKFIKELEKGADLVLGNRFKGKIEQDAMPWMHQYIGNPVLSGMLRLFFNAKVHDSHSGMRAIKRDALDKLELRATGMEFASEMIIMAGRHKLKIKEIPIDYYKRRGKSKLKTFSDGWRHLRFMLMYAPNYLFLIPGFIFLVAGFGIFAGLLFGFARLIILGSFFVILGYQIIALGLYAKAYMKSIGFIESDRLLDFITRFVNFESGLLIGIMMLALSFLDGIVFFATGGINSNEMIIILTLAILGVQTIFSAFMMSIMLVERR